MDNKEKWADEVLKSLEGIENAKPDNDLFDKIVARIPSEKENGIISLKQLGWAAVAASVVILLNIYAFKLQNDSVHSDVDGKKDEISLLTDYSF